MGYKTIFDIGLNSFALLIINVKILSNFQKEHGAHLVEKKDV
jgi:hypothetical protein